jgi:hypothetical protein
MSSRNNGGRSGTSDGAFDRGRIEWVCCNCASICDVPRTSSTCPPSCTECEHVQCFMCSVTETANDWRLKATKDVMHKAATSRNEMRAPVQQHGTLDTVPDYSDDDAGGFAEQGRSDALAPLPRISLLPSRTTNDSHVTHATSATEPDDADDSSASDSSGGFVKSLQKYRDRKLNKSAAANESIRLSNESRHISVSQATAHSAKAPVKATDTVKAMVPASSPVFNDIDASPITPGKPCVPGTVSSRKAPMIIDSPVPTAAHASTRKAAMIIDSQDDVVSIISPPTTAARHPQHTYRSENDDMIALDEELARQIGAEVEEEEDEEEVAEVTDEESSTGSEDVKAHPGAAIKGGFLSANAYKRACPADECDSTDSDDLPLRDLPLGSQPRPSIFDEDTDIELSSDEEIAPAADMYDESFVGVEDYEDFASIQSGEGSPTGGAAARAPSVDSIDFIDLIDDPIPTAVTSTYAQPAISAVQGAAADPGSHITPAGDIDPKLPFFRSVAVLNMQRLMGKDQVYINYNEQFRGACMPVKQGSGPKTKGGSASDAQNKKLVEQREESRLKRRAERAKERKLAWVQKAVEMLQEEGLLAKSGAGARKTTAKSESGKAPNSKKARPSLDDDDTHEARTAAPKRTTSAAPAAGFVTAKSLSHEHRTVSSGDHKSSFDIISTARPKSSVSAAPLRSSSHVRSNYDVAHGYDDAVPPRQSNLRAMPLPIPAKKASSSTPMAGAPADSSRPWIERVAIQSAAPQLKIASVPNRNVGSTGLSALVSSKEFKKPRPALPTSFDYDMA